MLPQTFLNISLEARVHILLLAVYIGVEMVGPRIYISSDLEGSSKLSSMLLLILLLPSVLKFPLFYVLSDTDIIGHFHSGWVMWYPMVALISIPLITYEVEHLSYSWAIYRYLLP